MECPDYWGCFLKVDAINGSKGVKNMGCVNFSLCTQTDSLIEILT